VVDYRRLDLDYAANTAFWPIWFEQRG
jgi:hypothetical protein